MTQSRWTRHPDTSRPDLDPTKDPEDWVTGDEPMTGPQRSYLETLSREAGEEPDNSMTKAEASERIDELQRATGRGADPFVRDQDEQPPTDGTAGDQPLPDDRYDATDSGPDGTDLPYPPNAGRPAPTDSASDGDGRRPPAKPATEPRPEEPTSQPGPARASGTDYGSDGPDDLADKPQR